jgi:hypothetical protein
VEQSAGLDPVLAAIAVVASIAGTSLARPVLARLTDGQYRLWTWHIITTIGVAYLVTGAYLLVQSALA